MKTMLVLLTTMALVSCAEPDTYDAPAPDPGSGQTFAQAIPDGGAGGAPQGAGGAPESGHGGAGNTVGYGGSSQQGGAAGGPPSCAQPMVCGDAAHTVVCNLADCP